MVVTGADTHMWSVDQCTCYRCAGDDMRDMDPGNQGISYLAELLSLSHDTETVKSATSYT